MKLLLTLSIFFSSISLSLAQDEVYKVVGDMPRILGCEDLESRNEKKACSNEKLISFISENLIYPEVDKKNKVVGRAIVQFIIDLDGKTTDLNIIRSVSATSDQSIIKLFELMNQEITWRPGHIDDRAVKVLYTLPILFRIPKKEKK